MDNKDNNKDFKKKIDDFQQEYKKILEKTIKEFPKFNVRLNDIYDLSEEIIEVGCKKEIDELNKYLKFDLLSTDQLIPLEGKKKEAQFAYNKFLDCSFLPSSIIDNFKNIEAALISVNKSQIEYCKEDCIKNNKMDYALTKNCVKDCIDFTFNYSRIATYDIIDISLDRTEKEIKRIKY